MQIFLCFVDNKANLVAIKLQGTPPNVASLISILTCMSVKIFWRCTYIYSTHYYYFLLQRQCLLAMLVNLVVLSSSTVVFPLPASSLPTGRGCSNRPPPTPCSWTPPMIMTQGTSSLGVSTTSFRTRHWSPSPLVPTEVAVVMMNWYHTW